VCRQRVRSGRKQHTGMHPGGKLNLRG
jgi:hypothetical protein